VQNLLDNPALKLYALAVAILAIQLLLIAFWTGTVRAMNKTWVNPEDAALNKGTQADVDHPAVQRVKRAHQNALENAVPFVAVGGLYALTNPGMTMAQILFFGFVGVRVLHTVFYLSNKQPFRTMMFAIGAVLTVIMAVQVIRAAV